MTQPTQTITKCTDNLTPNFTSVHRSGNRPAAGALTLYGTCSNRNACSLKTNGTYAFGTIGPNLIWRTVLRNSTAGQDYPILDYIGNGAISYSDINKKLPIVAAASMPYGKAFAIGGNSASYV